MDILKIMEVHKKTIRNPKPKAHEKPVNLEQRIIQHTV